MAGTREKDHFGVMLPDYSAQVGIDEGKPGARAPMPEQPTLDMFGLQ